MPLHSQTRSLTGQATASDSDSIPHNLAIMPPHSQTKSLTGQASASASASDLDSTPRNHKQDHNYYVYEGERLARLLQSLQREIESVRLVEGKALPEKIWFKQQFAIGVNEVSRALERMKPQHALTLTKPYLQAVVVASDASPRWLTKHLPSLASSRNVPLLFLRDNKHASLRLAQLFKLKTAIAIGIKAKGNSINQLFAQILRGDDSVDDGTDRSLRLSAASNLENTCACVHTHHLGF